MNDYFTIFTKTGKNTEIYHLKYTKIFNDSVVVLEIDIKETFQNAIAVDSFHEDIYLMSYVCISIYLIQIHETLNNS